MRSIVIAPATGDVRLSNFPGVYLSAAAMATEARVNWTVETPGDGKRAEKVSPIQRAEIKQAAVPWIDLPKDVLLPPGKDPAIAPHASEMVAIAITAGPIPPGASEASEAPQKYADSPET